MGYIMEIQINKKELNSMFKISEVTISKTYNKIFPWVRIIADNELTDNVISERVAQIIDTDEIYITNKKK
jgi:hypothetical protein